ncbi:MAG: ABC transporter ATP-binding protein [Betaproteobacteria bacterium]
MTAAATTTAVPSTLARVDAQLALVAIEHAYDRHRVLDGLSLTLQRGEIGCLLGASACGKTTVLRCIAGFEPVTAGEIWLNGTLVTTAGMRVPTEKRRIGMVFQDYALFPHLDIAQNVGFGLHGLDKTERAVRVEELLEIVGLGPAAHQFPHELSGGQQQRVALARALAPRPDLLLLDEPFSNLDVELRERLSIEVRDILKQHNTTAMLVTHDQHEAFNIADVIGVMSHGTIEQWDTPYKLYHEPATRFVADFIGQGAFLPGTVLDGNRVRLELGEFPTRFPSGWWPGAAVDVLLRPDDVLHDDSSPLQAEVLHKAFRGAEFLYTLRLAGGGQVMSLVPSHHDHAIGERIGIRIELEHLVAYRR